MEPLDSVVNAATILAVGALLTGALWGVVSADPKRKVGVKAFVRAFSKFVAAMLVATIIYYLPSYDFRFSRLACKQPIKGSIRAGLLPCWRNAVQNH